MRLHFTNVGCVKHAASTTKICVNKPWNKSAGGLNQLSFILVQTSVCMCVCVCLCWFYLRSPSHLDGTEIKKKKDYKNLIEKN
jgi:hypothetical protein